MKKQSIKKYLPFIAALLIFLSLTFVYFSPLFEGKKLNQHDILQWKGMSKEVVDYREKTGEEPLWTNSMFGGMPAWQISVKYSSNLIKKVDQILKLGLPTPANTLFLYFLGFFVLLLVLRVNPWVSVIGAIAYAFSTYFIIIFGAGHNSKAHAIAYMAPVLAGIIWAYRGELWKGAVLFALALALEINANHFQITFYLLFIVLGYGIYRFVQDLKNKNLGYFWKATAVLILGAGLAVATNITNIAATYQYAKHTMRGKPELTKKGGNENKSGGLDKDYITAWSYGIGETWSLMIPNAKGGATGHIGNIDALKKAEAGYRKTISQQNAYWGNQPFTAGPVYVGAVVIFLFILGMFIVKDRLKWVLFALTVFSILLAWGKNFMPLTDLFIDYFPMYNKFRTVSMILVIAELTIPLLAFITVNEIIKNPDIIKQNIKAFYISLGLTGGVALLFWLMPTTFFNFFSHNELQQFNMLKQSNNPAQVDAFMTNLENVRIAIFKADALRSFLFITAAAGLIWFYSFKLVKKGLFLTVLGLMVIADLFPVNKRYVNEDNFVRKTKFDHPFKKSKADAFILKDTNPDYRVLDITKNIFNDAGPSYWHKNIGGYHAAKLQRYQDLIDYHLMPEIQKLKTTLQKNARNLDNTLKNLQVINMLNTKYIIYNPDSKPIINHYAFGNAWFVNDYVLVKDANEEIDKIGEVNLKETAVIDKRFVNQVEGKHFSSDSTALIRLTSYAPNQLIYDYSGSKENMVVFSEIYYPEGWDAFIDGKPAEYFRADYVLRAMVVPAGKHTIEYKFEPKIWTYGNIISLISSLLIIILVIWFIVREIMKTHKTPGLEA